MNCMHCRGRHDVVITVERAGFLRHYHACFDHIEQVANRLRDDVGASTHQSLEERSRAARAVGVIDTTVIDTTESPRQLGR